jgi:hypothetical protein
MSSERELSDQRRREIIARLEAERARRFVVCFVFVAACVEVAFSS